MQVHGCNRVRFTAGVDRKFLIPPLEDPSKTLPAGDFDSPVKLKTQYMI